MDLGFRTRPYPWLSLCPWQSRVGAFDSDGLREFPHSTGWNITCFKLLLGGAFLYLFETLTNQNMKVELKRNHRLFTCWLIYNRNVLELKGAKLVRTPLLSEDVKVLFLLSSGQSAWVHQPFISATGVGSIFLDVLSAEAITEWIACWVVWFLFTPSLSFFFRDVLYQLIQSYPPGSHTFGNICRSF